MLSKEGSCSRLLEDVQSVDVGEKMHVLIVSRFLLSVVFPPPYVGSVQGETGEVVNLSRDALYTSYDRRA